MSVERVPLAEPFNPADPGTAEHRWHDMLRQTPDWLPPAQPLLVVSPHPDDEVLGAGGLMRIHALAGFNVTVLSVTDGAAAYPDWLGLDVIRKRELEDALHVLGGGNIQLVHLDLPDGQIDAYGPALYEAIGRRTLRRPIVVAPYEYDGHPDHDAAGRVCTEIARREGLTLIRYPVWTWHHATPETFVGKRWGRVLLDPATRHAKARAIECFASQLQPPGRAPIVPTHVLTHFKRTYEAFLL